MITHPKIQRIGKKSLRVVDFGRFSIVYSYNTPIAIYDEPRNELALGLRAYKHSVTTTKHVGAIMKHYKLSRASTLYLSESYMRALADAKGFTPTWHVPTDTRRVR